MHRTNIVAIASSLFATTLIANAGVINGGAPPLDIELRVSANPVWSDSPDGMSVGDGTFAYQGAAATDTWSLEYEAITFGGDAGVGKRGDRLSWVNLSLEITNIGGAAQHYTFSGNMPIAPAIIPAVMGGSAQGGMTSGAAPATLASLSGSSMYAGLIDLAVASGSELFADPTSISAGAFQSESLGAASFGMPIPSDPAPNVLNTLGVRFDFLLDPGATATFSGIFVVNIPTPASLALLGVAGIFFVRRHRA